MIAYSQSPWKGYEVARCTIVLDFGRIINCECDILHLSGDSGAHFKAAVVCHATFVYTTAVLGRAHGLKCGESVPSGYSSSFRLMPISSRKGFSSSRYSSYWWVFSTFALMPKVIQFSMVLPFLHAQIRTFKNPNCCRIVVDSSCSF